LAIKSYTIRKGIIASLLLLLASTGCVQRYADDRRPQDAKTYAETHKEPYEPLTQYREDEVREYLAEMDRRFDTPGFKGLHLGMTCEQVNGLVKETPWGYLLNRSPVPEKSSAEWPNEPQCVTSNFLKTDHSDMGGGWATIGCDELDEGGECYGLAYVNIKYLDDKLILINLSSPSRPPERIETSLKDWARCARKVLIRQYGEPDKVAASIEDIGQSSFKAGYEVPLCEWNRGGERIVLYLSEYSSTYGCGVILEDVEGFTKTVE
jgi:hypothetical protein